MRLHFSCLLLPLVLAACAVPDDGPVGRAREAMMVCAGPTTLNGLDISHYDGDIDWAQVAAAGNSFAFAKATEGTTFTDPKFAQNWAGMKQNGVVRGAYHFFHANDDPIAEADFLLQTMGPLEPGDLPPTLDLEVSDGESASTVTNNAIAWLDHVAEATGRKPILYTSRRVVTDYLGNAMGLEQHAVLWDANWQVSCPDLPDTYATWAFWQDTNVGTVPGVAGMANVDLDVFNGGLTDLQALGGIPSSGSGGGGGSSSNGTSGVGGGSGGSTSASTSSGAGGNSTHTTGVGGDLTNSGGGGSANDSGTAGGCSLPARGRAESGAGFGLAMLLVLGARRRVRR